MLTEGGRNENLKLRAVISALRDDGLEAKYGHDRVSESLFAIELHNSHLGEWDAVRGSDGHGYGGRLLPPYELPSTAILSAAGPLRTIDLTSFLDWK